MISTMQFVALGAVADVCTVSCSLAQLGQSDPAIERERGGKKKDSKTDRQKGRKEERKKDMLNFRSKSSTQFLGFYSSRSLALDSFYLWNNFRLSSSG